MPPDDFVGFWNLVSAEFEWSNGERADLYGPRASGLLVYGPDGQMSVQIMRLGRPAFAADDARRGTPEEIRPALEGYLAYFGTFSVDAAAGAVTHHLRGSLFPNWVGQDLTRFYAFAGNRLTLRAPPMLTAGRLFTGTLVWERAA